jgi:2-polyprenyl-6-methoxyphenol hydroxylase-like FAD-dependent oxidoreductase
MTETAGTKLSSPVRSAPAVLIVGAGPTGLTLACELARRGVSFRLIEAVPARSPARAARASSRAPSRYSAISASSIV